MRSGQGKLVAGIVIFLALVLFPVWYGVARGSTRARPDLGDLKKITGAERCVRDLETMRSQHMILLDGWRDLVVREGQRVDAQSGREMSLTRTCLGCHANYQDFCARCHDYVGVDPYCWDCHVVPEGS